MLKATGVKMECMKEDNDMEKKQGFLQKRQTTDSPQSSLEKLGTNVSQKKIITVSHFLPDSFNVWEVKVNCEVVWMIPFNNRKC